MNQSSRWFRALTYGLLLGVAGCASNSTPPRTTTTAPQKAVEIRESAAHDAEVVRLLTIAYVVLSATTTTTTPPPQNPSPGGTNTRPTGDFLACVKDRESGGDYSAVSPGGDWRGAYQFAPGTWNSTAQHAGRPDLIGVDPATASPADQDALAQHLLGWQGTGPWAGGNWPC